MNVLMELYAQKNKADDLLFTRYISRNIAVIFVVLFIKLKVSPNAVTILTIIANVMASSILLMSDTGLAVFVYALMLQLMYILDCSDGMLARYVGKGSATGAWFDLVVDRLNQFIIMSTVLVYELQGNANLLSDVELVASILLFFGTTIILANAINLKTILVKNSQGGRSKSHGKYYDFGVSLLVDYPVMLIVYGIPLLLAESYKIIFYQMFGFGYLLLLLILINKTVRTRRG
ncbi:MAG: CDP-alcohol phosphatidyltransferase family protein [Gammaproteobacteria bacterium]|nr:CDP-alcohol phosphatidyltransferase family protein [Gammaproteobacteria bacterium]